MAPERGARPLPAEPPASTEGLPKAFLQSLRTLFDILDDRRRGYVHLREIESRWQGAEARELPAGVLDGLRQAAPASGYLTFERFVLGLRAALLSADGGLPGEAAEPARRRGAAGAERRTPGAGAGPAPLPSPTVMATGRLSLQVTGALMLSSVTGADAKPAGPSQGDGSHSGAGDARRHQRGRAEHRRHTITNGVDFSVLKHMKDLEQEKDFLLQGLEMVERTREWYHQHIQFMQERQRLLGKNKTNTVRSGLPCGLGELSWDFLVCWGRPPGRLTVLFFPSSSLQPMNPSSALNRLGPAAPVVSPASAGSQQAISMLKEQNRLLTKEVTDKSERITQLEQEKSALIKQLFEARALNNHETSQLDSTFI
uniref:Suppressor APC domain containing 2 n=1 Tax=Apteryx owenii TaxID=8824 RepID=A0A8B9S2C5_APTOW